MDIIKIDYDKGFNMKKACMADVDTVSPPRGLKSPPWSSDMVCVALDVEHLYSHQGVSWFCSSRI